MTPNKTPSKRLRSVIYLLWKQGKQDIDQDEYYEIIMEKLIEKMKGKLK